MARDINDIEKDIARTRRQLASTLDELAERTKPQHLVDDAKEQASQKLTEPKVQKILAGVAAAVAVVVVVSIARSRRNRRDLKEIRKLLAAND